MSGLTGFLGADFESFTDACAQAEVSLTGFEAGAAKVETQLNKVSDSLSGVRVVAQATLASEAVDRLGGVSKLTGAELQRVGAIAQEARAKLVALGQDVPPEIQRLADATQNAANQARGARPPFDDLRGSISQFDGVLAAMGLHIGPELRGLEDLSGAVGKNAADLGTFATAGLAAGAAIGGWKLGRLISEAGDLDKTIGDLTAKALGWGDVAAQEAGAGADVLARASKNAGFQVTDFGYALQLNQAELAKEQAALKKTTDEAAKYAVELIHITEVHASNADKMSKTTLAFLAAEDAFKKNAADQNRELDADAAREAVLANGTASEIIKQQNHDVYLAKIADMEKAGTLTEATRAKALAFEDAANQHDLVNQRTLHTGKLQDLQDEAAMERRTYEEMIAHADQYTRGALQAQLDKVRELEFAATAQGRAMADGQERAADKTDDLNAKLEREIELAGRLAKNAQEFGGSFDVTAGNLKASVGGLMAQSTGGKTADAINAYGGLAEGLAEEGYSFEEIMAIIRGGRKGKPVGPRIPGFVGGVEDFGGGAAIVGERGPELLQLPRGSNVIPFGRAGGGSSIVVHQYVSGVFDPASQDVLGKTVSEELWRRVMNARLG